MTGGGIPTVCQATLTVCEAALTGRTHVFSVGGGDAKSQLQSLTGFNRQAQDCQNAAYRLPACMAEQLILLYKAVALA